MDTPPDQLGPYRLLNLLGEGGMGQVWRALDLRLERPVALKLLKGPDATRRRALLLEARTACQLQHPNIAVIFEAGETDGQVYMAMELVEGQSLGRRVDSPQPLELLLTVARQTALGLQHAHDKGIIHRDIKPENLYLTPQGTLKVLDFGVSKRAFIPETEATCQSLTVPEATRVGIASGTPSYMSPEQALGHPQGPACDQFSLGTVLFELATGIHPFRRTSLVETLHAVAKENAPDLAALRPDLPRAFVQAVQRLMAKAPEARFPSLQAFQDHLQGLDPTARIRWRPTWPRLHRPSRLAWILGGLVLVAGAAGSVTWLRHSRPVGRRVVAILPVQTLGLKGELAWLGMSLQDTMASALVRQGDLLVLDRLRVEEVAGRDGRKVPLSRLVQELGADLVLEGSLRAIGSQLRLNVRVLSRDRLTVLKELQLPAQESELLELEEAVAQRLPRLISGGQASAVPARARQSATRQHYAKALEWVQQGNLEVFQAARREFEACLALEPDYAPAHAGLAWALLEAGSTGLHLGQKEAETLLDQASEEARKAVALDPGLSLPHRVLGQIHLRRSAFGPARLEAQQAVDLDPADHRAWVALADAYGYSDAPEDRRLGREHFQRALQLGPNDWMAHWRLAVLLQNDGELDEALRHADRARQLDPTAEYAHLTAATCLLWKGDLPGCRQRIQEGLQRQSGSALLRLLALVASCEQGDTAAARPFATALADRWPAEHPAGALVRCLQEDLAGRRDAALGLLRGTLAQVRARDWGRSQIGERRGASVNLYHMARLAALRQDRGLARDLLGESERLHPGKRSAAAKDPLLKGL